MNNKPIGSPQRERHIDIVPIAAPPVQYFIWGEDGKSLAGYALITVSKKEPKIIGAPAFKEAALWHIHTDRAYRRQGYAGCLLLALQETFDVIFTEALTDESKYLLRKHGFAPEGKFYYWRREKVIDGSK